MSSRFIGFKVFSGYLCVVLGLRCRAGGTEADQWLFSDILIPTSCALYVICVRLARLRCNVSNTRQILPIWTKIFAVSSRLCIVVGMCVISNYQIPEFVWYIVFWAEVSMILILLSFLGF